MATSRREFVWQSAAAVGAVLVPPGCEGGQDPAKKTPAKPVAEFEPGYLALERSGELARREEALWQRLAECDICARGCGTNRLAGETGVCSTPARFKVYSSGVSDYPEVAAEVIREMHRQVGDLQTDRKNIATRGLIIRHLVMPNNIGGTDKLVKWIADELGPDTYLNLMAQYRPEHQAHDMPAISRRINQKEWRQALTWAKEAGLTNVHT